MAQNTSGVRALLSVPAIYSSFQRLMGADSTWRAIAQHHLPLRPGARLLDVGCGPCDILRWLPEEVEYTGIDLNAHYVLSARERFGRRGTFMTGDAAALSLHDPAPFDVALAVGLLHHLDDSQATKLFQSLRPILKAGGCVVTIEPCLHPGQSAFEKFLMARDRGQNVRDEPGYRQLVPASFTNIQSCLIQKASRLPWTLMAMTAG